MEWKIEDVRKACDVELRNKDQLLEQKTREILTLRQKVQETTMTAAHTELIEKGAADIRELEKELEDREAQLRRAEDQLTVYVLGLLLNLWYAPIRSCGFSQFAVRNMRK